MSKLHEILADAERRHAEALKTNNATLVALTRGVVMGLKLAIAALLEQDKRAA